MAINSDFDLRLSDFPLRRPALFASRRFNGARFNCLVTALIGILPEGMSERRSRFDNQRGLGAGYGVPALAGRALSLGGGSKYLPINGETPSHRLQPGLHTLPSTGAVPQCPCRQGSGDKRRHWTAPPSHPWPISVVSVTPPILGRPSETEPFVPPPSLVSGALLLATSVVPP